jgi:hypothetical protein
LPLPKDAVKIFNDGEKLFGTAKPVPNLRQIYC